MKFGRKRRDQAGDAPAEGGADTGGDAAAAPADAPAEPAAPSSEDPVRAKGPWDVTETTLEEDDPTRVDLGGLVVKGSPGLELRLQVDERTQEVAAVMLVGEEGALELRPFAAPRNRDIWADIRRQIAAEGARRGGTADEAEGPFGPELRLAIPVTTQEGATGTQPSRVLGIAGPRWLLRATFFGKPAVEPDTESVFDAALRDVVVVRGDEAMAPGDPIPLHVPSNARRMPPERG